MWYLSRHLKRLLNFSYRSMEGRFTETAVNQSSQRKACKSTPIGWSSANGSWLPVCDNQGHIIEDDTWRQATNPERVKSKHVRRTGLGFPAILKQLPTLLGGLMCSSRKASLSLCILKLDWRVIVVVYGSCSQTWLLMFLRNVWILLLLHLHEGGPSKQAESYLPVGLTCILHKSVERVGLNAGWNNHFYVKRSMNPLKREGVLKLLLLLDAVTARFQEGTL